MNIQQMAVNGFAALSSAILLNCSVASAMAETLIIDSAPNSPNHLISANSKVGNCHNLNRDTIILSGSTAIFAQPQETIQFSPDTIARPILLKLAAPLLLTENCILGQTADDSTIIEAQLETTYDVEGLIIKTRSIVVSGHYLPLAAESNVIPFERHVEPSIPQPGNNTLCNVIGILPNVFIDSHGMGEGISPQDLTAMTGGLCEILFSQPAYFLQAELKADSFYNLRFSGVQSIPVPHALRGLMTVSE